MNKIVKVITASVLTVSMCGCAVSADEAKSTAAADTVSSEKKSSKKDASEAYTSQQTGKDETVYVFTGADGSMNHMVVSDTLHTAGKKGAVEDYSNLDNIENVSGDEKYSSDGNGNITWTSDGTDISYQGTTDKELPVDVKITYYLNGNEVSPEEIKGQSGHVKVHFDYTNNAETTITSDGEEKTVKVPFGMVTGLTLDASKFTNVTVTNGKMNQYNDSDVIYGLALPGLKESLETASVSDIDLTSVNIPEYFEFEADTTDFDIDLCMTIATSNLLSLLNTDDLNVSDFSGSIDQLTSSGQKLVDGTKSLKDGTSQLKSGAEQLDNGAASLLKGSDTLTSGASSLADGSKSLADGASSLKDGASQVNDGVNSLNDGAASLEDGAKSLADGAATLDSSMATAVSGAQQLTDGLAALVSKNDSLNSGCQQIVNAVFESANKQLQAQGYSVTLTESNYQEELNKIGNVSSDMLKTALGEVENQVQAALKAKGVDESALDSYGGLEGVTKILIYLSASANSAENALKEDNLTAAANSLLSAADTSAKQTAVQQIINTGSPWTNEKVAAALNAYASSDEFISSAESTGYSTILSSVKDGVNAALSSQGLSINDDQAAEILAYSCENNTADPVSTENLTAAATAVLRNAAVPASGTGLTNPYVKAVVDQAITAKAKSNLETLYNTIVSAVAATGANNDNAQLAVVYSAAILGSISSANLKVVQSLAQNGSSMQSAIKNASSPEGQQLIKNALSHGVIDSALSLVANQLGQVESFKAGLLTYTAGVSSVYSGSKSLLDGLGKLKDGTASLSSGASKLYDGAKTLHAGVQTLGSGTKSLADGSVSLADGANALKDGSATLYNGTLTLNSGVKTLKNGTSSLKTGVATLDDGAAALESGMEQFYEEGIKKIGDVLGEDLPAVVDSLKGLTNAGADYKTFSGALDDDNNSCKFIFKTEFDSDNN